jgi:anthranilate phosphoribosyltransferase
MLKPFIAKVMQGENLSFSEAETAMQIIMTGQATQAQIGGYLGTAHEGETVEEIAGSARHAPRPGVSLYTRWQPVD